MSDTKAVARAVVAANRAAVEAADSAIGETFEKAVAMLTECRGKVVTTGSGTSGAIAARAAHLLSVAGTPAFYLPAADGLHGGLGAISADDVVLAISKGGGSDELNTFCIKARERAALLIVITATERSPFSDQADIALVIDLPPDGDLGGVIATASSLAMATVTDALAEAARHARKMDWGEILSIHPSGAVGRDAQMTLKRLKG